MYLNGQHGPTTFIYLFILRTPHHEKFRSVVSKIRFRESEINVSCKYVAGTASRAWGRCERSLTPVADAAIGSW